MCKIFNMAGIVAENREDAMKLIESMAYVMSEDVSHQDGLGYAAVDHNGSLFAERWLNNDDAFDIRSPLTEQDKKTLLAYKGFISKEEKYNSYGTINLDNIAAITLHTRLATSGKGMLNTHPFIDGEVSVIHNGVISNPDEFRQGYSTCDSEAILTGYIDERVNDMVDNFSAVAKRLEGYYACGIFSIDGEGMRVMDIVKSRSAQLIAAYIPELNTIVYTSLESQLRKGLQMAGLTLGSVYDVTDSSIVRINPFDGLPINSSTFKESAAVRSSVYNKRLEYKKGEFHETTRRGVGMGAWDFTEDGSDVSYTATNSHYSANETAKAYARSKGRR